MAKFRPGQSGNPSGRPKGLKPSVAALRKELITDEDLRAIVDVVVEKAKEGDLIAAGMILDRRLPRLRVTEHVEASVSLEELVSTANSIPAPSWPQRANATSATSATPNPASRQSDTATPQPDPNDALPAKPAAKPQHDPPARKEPPLRFLEPVETGSDFEPYA